MVNDLNQKWKIEKWMTQKQKKHIRKARKIEKQKQKAIARRNAPSPPPPRPLMIDWPGKPKRYALHSKKSESKVYSEIWAMHKYGNLLHKYGFTKGGLKRKPLEETKEILHCIRKTEESLEKIKETIPRFHKTGLLQKYGISMRQLTPYHLRLDDATHARLMIKLLEDDRSSPKDTIYATHQLHYMSITGKARITPDDYSNNDEARPEMTTEEESCSDSSLMK